MKIYAMKGLFLDGGNSNPYMAIRALDRKAWVKRGPYEPSMVVMRPMAEDDSKPMGDFTMYGGYGLLSTKSVIDRFRKYAPANVIAPVRLLGADYLLLQPFNHPVDGSNLEHIFIMFRGGDYGYKSLLVTQLVKDEWEALGLTGAVFEQVAEMDDARFIPVPA